MLITGPTVAGKSFLAIALGQQACTQGLKTLYFNCNKLWSHLSQLRSRGRYEKEIKLISKADLVVLDDFGLVKLESTDRLFSNSEKIELKGESLRKRVPKIDGNLPPV